MNNNISYHRKRAGLTREQLAELIKTSGKRISMLETGGWRLTGSVFPRRFPLHAQLSGSLAHGNILQFDEFSSFIKNFYNL